jgi:hypothetical protein
VYFLEDSDDYPSCYDPVRDVTDTDPSYGLDFTAQTFARVGLGDRWAYYDAHTARWLGPRAEGIQPICASAEVLLNVSGVNPLRPWLQAIPHRVLIDTDPAFTQIRHLTDNGARERASQHTAFFSFGENLGRNSTIPDDGFPWQPTRQPIVLDAWPVTTGPPKGKFTTIMQWESYPRQEYAGRSYGMKADSFEPYLNLPERAGAIFELALGSPRAPRPLLASRGWCCRDPREPSRDPWTYQRFIQESRAEFGVAKHGYVVSRSGWFSERSAAYLASGRPVLVQETGFSDWLAAGSGVVAFRNPEEALGGIQNIGSRYKYHCQCARQIAEAYFDANQVLSCLLDRTAHAARPAV